MARAVWSGAVSFGLVNVPVKAFTAVRDHDVHFHQLEKDTGARIGYEKVSKKTGEPVDKDDIELGYEVGKGRYVTFDPDEVAELRPSSTRAIDVSDFVELDAIDPIYYERTYWLAPDGEAAERAYRLLLAAMEDRGRVGIGSVVMRNKQYLAAIRPVDGVLAMSTMRFADEVVPRADVDELPAKRSKPDAKELRLATQIVESLASEWDPSRYEDTYTEELRDLIERKERGEEITVEEAEPEGSKVLDLMAALQASVDAAKAGKPAAKRPAAKKKKKAAGAKKASARKSA
jgi:DNA end-binding protein Ku